ncbi:MAG: ribosomal L7Ae/L30e/S12e/Gadd45 family protein [archaeon]
MANDQTEKVYEIVELVKTSGKLKKGTNEVTKAIEKGVAKFVAYASDVNPKEVIMHLSPLCKEKGIPCFEVPSKTELGTAAGLPVGTSAIAVLQEGEAKLQIKKLAGDKKPVEEKPKEKPKEDGKSATREKTE